MSSQVFKGQGLLRIRLKTGYASLATASSLKILYTKPSGIKGSWTAIADGTDIYYDLVNGDIDEINTWQFQAKIVVGGRNGYGEVKSIDFLTTIE